MSDTGTDSDCTINNGDIANVDKAFDLRDISGEGTVDLTNFDILPESDNGDVDVHVDDNNKTFSNVLTCSTAVCVCSVQFII